MHPLYLVPKGGEHARLGISSAAGEARECMRKWRFSPVQGDDFPAQGAGIIAAIIPSRSARSNRRGVAFDHQNIKIIKIVFRDFRLLEGGVCIY